MKNPIDPVHGGARPNPEQELVKACFQVETDARKQAVAGIIPRVNWNRFKTLIHRNGGAPWIMHVLTREADQGSQGELETEWNKLFKPHVAFCMKMSGTLSKVTGLLEDEGIPVSAFKGPALGQLAYNDFALRTYVDLDIMIRGRDFVAAYKVLTEQAGFSPMWTMNRGQLTAWGKSGREFTFARDGVYLDLHQRLTEGPKRFTSDGILSSETERMELMGRDIRIFKTEAHFLLLALHGAKHGWPEMRMAGEAAFLAHRKGMDMKVLRELATRYGCRRAVDLALWLASALCGLTVDQYLTGTSAPDKRVVRIARSVAGRLAAMEPPPGKRGRFNLMLKLLDGFAPRGAFVWHTLTAPKLTDIKEGHGRKAWLLKLMRPFMLIRRRISGGKGKKH